MEIEERKVRNEVCRILVVDDEPISRMIHQHLLEQLGCTVTCANDGEEALRLIKNEVFDLAFVDFHMPKMSGLELTKAVRQLEKPLNDLPIIGITAEKNSAEHDKVKAAGMNDVIVKSSTDDAEETIKRFINDFARKGSQRNDRNPTN